MPLVGGYGSWDDGVEVAYGITFKSVAGVGVSL